jgi:energy-coupling factor transporter ATP-binding protein EcfA2
MTHSSRHNPGLSDAPLIEFENLAIGYDESPLLANLNLSVPRGSFTGLLGSNGSGKTTLIKTMLGILPPLSGTVRFNGANGTTLAIGYVPQRETLDSVYLFSAFEVALMGVYGRVRPGRFARPCGNASLQSAPSPSPTNVSPNSPADKCSAFSSPARWSPNPSYSRWTNPRRPSTRTPREPSESFFPSFARNAISPFSW